MNSETAVLVGIVLAVIMVVAVYTAMDGSIDQADSSLFGDKNSEGFFDTQKTADGDLSFKQTSFSPREYREVRSRALV